ncbi:MAG TPA: type II toxin-antitoxin system RelE/ParE family toxin [Salinivirgaceae bacterium]|nr:type II toxin-antitoxin system RelE/ParE family toxin [Salinivirgaceae bacterium]HQA75990.1 type II toxin-antitoxin system RelE/ParE family toxin [Salinivirgaceae bacterium]
MENGYKILWTNNALLELQKTCDYLEANWTERELRKLSIQIDKTLRLIAKNPKIFQQSRQKGIRRSVVMKYNTLYYREIEESKVVEILSFFSNRRDPR